MNQNIKQNLATIIQLHTSCQFAVHDFAKLISTIQSADFQIPEPYPEFTTSLNSQVSTVGHNISKARNLLKVNWLIIQGITVEEDKLGFLVEYEKFSWRFKDLHEKLNDLKLEIFDLYQNILKCQRRQKLQRFQLNEQQQEQESGSNNQNTNDLFAGRSQTSPTTDLASLSTNQKVLKTNQSITSVLQSTYSMMESNVINSDLLIDTFSESTNSLTKLSDRYEFLSTTLLSSKNLVNELQKADSSDLKRMKMALAFFAACCFWVIWRRVLKYPVKFFIWIIWKTFVGSLYLFGILSGGSEEAVGKDGVSSTIDDVVVEATTSIVEKVSDTVVEIASTLINDEL
ncbi:Sec20 protein [Saccharomycopsis crataegensis]|uniref:Sec20 protein n=1 Tax=Saccharomycopsis crataegensis TaxID=43959 RepID=A0AAV5QVG4_9ASCO|nr:Sec20 protein [Saccharomycopsis crataegensis]